MQEQELAIEVLFEGLLVSEVYSRRLAADRFYRMNPTKVPLLGFEELSAIEVLDIEQLYCSLLRFGYCK